MNLIKCSGPGIQIPMELEQKLYTYPKLSLTKIVLGPAGPKLIWFVCNIMSNYIFNIRKDLSRKICVFF